MLVGITDAGGNLIARYSYDEWGRQSGDGNQGAGNQGTVLQAIRGRFYD